MNEVQDVFRLYGGAYRQKHALPLPLLKAMSAIERCRTAELGAHADVCEDCGYTRIAYNSCRDRHCPKCQFLAKERWIQSRNYDLLNVGYFHVVFTIPDTLNMLVFQNQRELYPVLFRAAAEAMQELSASKKYLGAQIGLTSILHTWGQNLCYHPHVHCIVPGGGIDTLGKWRPSSQKFFLPVRVLSRLFRGKFLYHLAKAKLGFHDDLEHLSDPFKWSGFLSKLYKQEWFVYCKAPFRDARCVVNYLGRYTHRIAIANSRILNIDDGRVSFKWKDYKDNCKWKVMTLPAEEFIRRFLMHILPYRFMKIRHYGFLGNRGKTKRLKICKILTRTPILPDQKFTTAQLIQEVTGIDPTRCQACGSDKLKRCPAIDSS
jgi:predicted Zn-ribbon and HTH transcriptional regulator